MEGKYSPPARARKPNGNRLRILDRRENKVRIASIAREPAGNSADGGSRAGWARPRPKPRARRQGLVQHQHLADRLGSDEADETATDVDHGDGRRRFFLQHAKGIFPATAVTDWRHARSHELGDAGVG